MAAMTRDIEQGLPGSENILLTCGADKIVIANAGPPNEAAAGKSLTEIATERGIGDVEAIYEQADLLLDGFQDYLRERGVAREERVNYDEMLQGFVDDYLAAYEVGKLTDMTRDEIDTYLQDFLLERERVSKRKLTETKQAFGSFYTFLSERGHMPQTIAEPIIQYCQR